MSLSRVAAAFVVATACVVTACGTESRNPAGPTGAAPIGAETPNPYEATFGPGFAASPPEGNLARLDDATISEDGMTVTVAFVGGGAYERGNFCTTDYTAWAGLRADALQVRVVRVLHPEDGAPPPNVGCAAVGHMYTFHLRLPFRFAGSTVEDGLGTTLWVRPPIGLVQPRQLPAGWELRWTGDEPAAAPPLYVRVYGPAGAGIAGPNRGAGQLDLYQAFGAATAIGGGDERRDVFVGRIPAVLNRDAGLGELLLQWTLGRDGVALVANEADISTEELLEIARSIHVGGP